MDIHTLRRGTPKDYYRLCTAAVLVLLAGALVWLAISFSRLSDKHDALVATLSADKQAQDISEHSDGWSTRITSGKGAFAMTLPDGWGSMIKVKNEDILVKAGTSQPDLGKGKRTMAVETTGYGHDGPTLFAAMLVEKGATAPPRGDASEFNIGKAEGEIKGTKYTYIYPKDDIIGIGALRLQGDRDYEYVLPMDGKELHVFYGVYGSDPRNLIETIDQIVQSVAWGK